jgi:hypothetical protein
MAECGPVEVGWVEFSPPGVRRRVARCQAVCRGCDRSCWQWTALDSAWAGYADLVEQIEVGVLEELHEGTGARV